MLEYNPTIISKRSLRRRRLFFFFFNDPPPTESSPLPLHDVLPINHRRQRDEDGARQAQLDQLEGAVDWPVEEGAQRDVGHREQHHRREEHRREVAENFLKKWGDRKSTRLNSSHSQISYAVFCLKKK